LGIVLLLLVMFRLGQFMAYPRAGAEQSEMSTGSAAAGAVRDTQPSGMITGQIKPGETIKPGGNNRIVIAQYPTDRDLRPVQEHFSNYGIATIIEKRPLSNGRTRYFLLTRDTYDNPNRAGTNGYKVRMRIKEIGAEYKAPPGYEKFTPRLFSDAYGEKIEQ